MQFLTALFGGSENALVNAVIALGIVLTLIVLGVWVLKAFFRASTTLVRGRNKRLTVIDAVVLDPKRRLILVRRDDVEHLILTGGPQDLVVESGITVDRANRPTVGVLIAQRPIAEPHGPSQPVNDAVEAAQALSGTAPNSPMARLRELARPVTRASRSLRHTGLLRPVSRMEPAAVIPMNPDNSDTRRIDSAKTGAANDSNGQAKLGAGKYPGDGIKAEGS
jgi:hypothetical protein